MKKIIIVICAVFYGTFLSHSQCDLKLKDKVLNSSKTDGFVYLKDLNFELSELNAVAKYNIILNEKSDYRIYLGISDKYPSEVDFLIYKGKKEIKKMYVSQGIDHLDFSPDTTAVYNFFAKNAKGAKSCGVIVLALLGKNTQNPANSQVTSVDEVYVMVDEMPQFIKGDDMSLPKWVMQNLKYPENAKKKGIQGRAYVQFVVDKEGNVRDVEVIKGLDKEIDTYLVEFFKTCPKWQKPGKKDNKNVNTMFTMPVQLKLQ